MSEIKKRSSRYPTCGRTPSRRLHPELFLSPHPSQLVEAGTSREHTVELSTPRPPSSSGAVCSKEVSLTIQQDTDEDSSDSLSADSDNDSSIIRTPLRPPLHILPLTTMAASVQKFIAPPVFSASPEEDAVDWIERFELAAAYNRWTDADQARNFVMYLEGPARKWFLVNTHPNHWEDLPARPDPTDPTLPHLPAESGIKTQFSAAFQQANFSLLQEAKLRQRTQGNEEDVVSYFYDIVNMCRLVNPNMSQEQQLEYLYRGLKPSLLQKIYPQKPASTADFLDLAKLHMEATMLANQKVWSQSILAVSKEPTLSNAGNNTQPAAMTPEIVSILQQLNHTIKQLQLSSGPTNHSAPSRPRQGHWNGSGKNGRTTEGRYICGFCSKVGHLDYRCFQNPASSLFKGATQPQNQQRSPPQQYPGGRPEFGRQRTQEQHWPVNHMSTEAGIGEMQDRQWPVNHISTEAAMGETTTTDSPWVQEKQKRDYDANHRDVTFQKGDKVLVYKPIRKKGKSDKLLHRWVGPFIVVRQTTPVNYEVKLVNEKTKSDIVHVVSMKPFKEIENWRNDTNSQTEAEKNNRPHQEITGHQSAETQAQPQVQKEGVEVKECSNSQKSQPSNTTQQKNQQDVVKLYDNNQKRTTELPPRIRRRPSFFMAGMIYFLSLIILGIMDSSTAIMIRDTVLFKDQPGISISESSWTIVADVLLQDAEEAIVIVEKHLEEMSSLAAKHRKDGANFEKMDAHTAWRDTTSFMAADKIDKKVLLLSRAVNNSKSRLTTCALTLSGAGRPKRGVLDAGGSMLKWLFGVTTQADLLDLHNKIETMGKQNREIVHVLDKHASIVNETLQLTRENLVLLQELQQQSAILNKRVDYILDYIQSYELVHIQQEQYFAELDATFDTIEHVIRWLQQQIEDWEIGLSTLASGHISPQMFPPTELQRVIKEINNNLPLGWTIPSEELWVIYREARVSVAAIHNKFRLFIEIPIYDHAQQFNLFQIIKLSKPTANGTHGVRFTNLPEYLAVSPDLDTFIELSDLEMLNCRQLDKQLCKFHTGFAKRGKKKSCAIALFTNDETQANACCQTQFTQWNGPEIAYLGQNRWAFSTSGPHDVVFSCPPDSKHLPPQRLQLPAIGYFEVPPGCTARTEDWIFPASLEGSSTAAAVSIKMPDFAEFRQNITSQKTATVVQFPSLNTSHFNQTPPFQQIATTLLIRLNG
ncbi:Uncharacterized protein APZ42_013879 [Daphnia magna]|uniref:Integrase p58-like C-terminal domain-containing protein n=1 Tax=Daphnia magna TaxID=35525 RepID=A0A162QDZ8_9CRUS|nr:Uncharacterized protein APZ42_013879 [Daphnia magna]